MIEGNTIRVTDYFGGCPKCGDNDGYLNVNRDHWCVCDKHKLRWLIGSNLFSDWLNEDESVWAKNRSKLEDCTEVQMALPEGVWSIDPETRRRQLEDYRAECEKLAAAAEQQWAKPQFDSEAFVTRDSVATGRMRCPECGAPPTVRCYDIIGCRPCGIAWGDGFDEQDIDRARDDMKFLASCEWKSFVRNEPPPAISLDAFRAKQSSKVAPILEPGDHDRVIGTLSGVVAWPRRGANADDDDVPF